MVAARSTSIFRAQSRYPCILYFSVSSPPKQDTNFLRLRHSATVATVFHVILFLLYYFFVIHLKRYYYFTVATVANNKKVNKIGGL
jgi:hypothetical protein